MDHSVSFQESMLVSNTIPANSSEYTIYDISFASNSTTNITTKRDQNLAQIEIGVQAAIFVLAVLGNGVVLIVLLFRRQKLTRMNLMIVHLGFADLFVALFNVLPQLCWDITGGLFQGGDFMCRVVSYFQAAAMYSSSYVLVTTAIDRWLAICHPFTTHTWATWKTHALVAAAWGISFLFSLPQIFIFSYVEVDTGIYNCRSHFQPDWTLQFYLTWATVAIYVIPLILLGTAYGRICYVVWKSIRSKENSTRRRGNVKVNNGNVLAPESTTASSISRTYKTCSPRVHVRGISKAKVKTVKLTLTVIISYLLCWGPFFVAQMWSVWDPLAPFEGPPMVIILLLASLNSCTNPWIYLAFSGKLRWRKKPRRADLRLMTNSYDSELRSPSTHISPLTETCLLESNICSKYSPVEDKMN